MTRRRPRSTGTRRDSGPSEELANRRVAVYGRRSTDEEHQPYSIEAQTIRLDAYIASQPGWIKAATFSDNTSAKDTHRPGLRAALTAARSGLIDMLLVLKVDRFSRRQPDLVALVEELTSLDVAFVSATEGSTPPPRPGGRCCRCSAPLPSSNEKRSSTASSPGWNATQMRAAGPAASDQTATDSTRTPNGWSWMRTGPSSSSRNPDHRTRPAPTYLPHPTNQTPQRHRLRRRRPHGSHNRQPGGRYWDRTSDLFRVREALSR
jgi:Resolvase, N terminal domain